MTMADDKVTLTLNVTVDASELEAAAARWDLRERTGRAETDLRNIFDLIGTLEDRVKDLEAVLGTFDAFRSKLETTREVLEPAVAGQRQDLDKLEERVVALEARGPKRRDLPSPEFDLNKEQG